MSRSKKKHRPQQLASVRGWNELSAVTQKGRESDLLEALLKRASAADVLLTSIDQLGEFALTVDEIHSLLAIVKRIVPQALPGRVEPTAYERQKARSRNRQALISRAGRDIGPLPPIKDPERRKACERDLQLALPTYWPNAFSRPFSESHLVMIKRAELVILVSALFALAMPRGEGKTTICRHTVQWAINNAHAQFAFLVGATDEKGQESLQVIQADYESNPILAEDFPEICYPIWKLDGIRNRAKGQLLDGKRTLMSFGKRQLILPTVEGSPASGAIIKAGGLLSSLRGANHRLNDGTIIRPQLILLDDPQTRESAESPQQCAQRIRIITQDLLGMAGADGKLAALGTFTVVAPGDAADSILDPEKYPEWQGLRTSMLPAFPERMDLWAQYWDIFVAELLARMQRQTQKNAKQELWFVPPPATRFYEENRKEMDRGAIVSNPYRKRADELSAIQHAMNWFLRDEAAFFSEFQNDPKDPAAQEEFLTASQIANKVNGYTRGMVPLGVQWLTCSIDCHARALTWMVCGFEPNFTGYLVDYGVYPEQKSPYWRMGRARPTLKELFPGTGDEGSLYQGIKTLGEKLLNSQWKREDDATMVIDRGLIDQGYQAATIQRCLREQGWHSRLFAAFGREIGPKQYQISQYRRRAGELLGEEWLLKKGRGKGSRNVQFDTGYWKTFLARRLATIEGDPGCFSLFGKEPKNKSRNMPERSANHEFLARHLDSEVRTVLKDGDRAVDQWRLRPGSENHWLDNAVHCHVAASQCGAKIGGIEIVKRAHRRLTEIASKRNRTAA